ncbi:unnamed protein product [Amoebophrya sp. A120]|nr:unnamed protein product [Amoebophrya sp. A120]|eukprot:GSA120T00016506001.1
MSFKVAGGGPSTSLDGGGRKNVKYRDVSRHRNLKELKQQSNTTRFENKIPFQNTFNRTKVARVRTEKAALTGQGDDQLNDISETLARLSGVHTKQPSAGNDLHGQHAQNADLTEAEKHAKMESEARTFTQSRFRAEALSKRQIKIWSNTLRQPIVKLEKETPLLNDLRDHLEQMYGGSVRSWFEGVLGLNYLDIFKFYQDDEKQHLHYALLGGRKSRSLLTRQADRARAHAISFTKNQTGNHTVGNSSNKPGMAQFSVGGGSTPGLQSTSNTGQGGGMWDSIVISQDPESDIQQGRAVSTITGIKRYLYIGEFIHQLANRFGFLYTVKDVKEALELEEWENTVSVAEWAPEEICVVLNLRDSLRAKYGECKNVLQMWHKKRSFTLEAWCYFMKTALGYNDEDEATAMITMAILQEYPGSHLYTENFAWLDDFGTLEEMEPEMMQRRLFDNESNRRKEHDYGMNHIPPLNRKWQAIYKDLYMGNYKQRLQGDFEQFSSSRMTAAEVISEIDEQAHQQEEHTILIQTGAVGGRRVDMPTLTEMPKMFMYEKNAQGRFVEIWKLDKENYNTTYVPLSGEEQWKLLNQCVLNKYDSWYKGLRDMQSQVANMTPISSISMKELVQMCNCLGVQALQVSVIVQYLAQDSLATFGFRKIAPKEMSALLQLHDSILIEYGSTWTSLLKLWTDLLQAEVPSCLSFGGEGKDLAALPDFIVKKETFVNVMVRKLHLRNSVAKKIFTMLYQKNGGVVLADLVFFLGFMKKNRAGSSREDQEHGSAILKFFVVLRQSAKENTTAGAWREFLDQTSKGYVTWTEFIFGCKMCGFKGFELLRVWRHLLAFKTEQRLTYGHFDTEGFKFYKKFRMEVVQYEKALSREESIARGLLSSEENVVANVVGEKKSSSAGDHKSDKHKPGSSGDDGTKQLKPKDLDKEEGKAHSVHHSKFENCIRRNLIRVLDSDWFLNRILRSGISRPIGQSAGAGDEQGTGDGSSRSSSFVQLIPNQPLTVLSGRYGTASPTGQAQGSLLRTGDVAKMSSRKELEEQRALISAEKQIARSITALTGSDGLVLPKKGASASKSFGLEDGSSSLKKAGQKIGREQLKMMKDAASESKDQIVKKQSEKKMERNYEKLRRGKKKLKKRLGKNLEELEEKEDESWKYMYSIKTAYKTKKAQLQEEEREMTRMRIKSVLANLMETSNAGGLMPKNANASLYRGANDPSKNPNSKYGIDPYLLEIDDERLMCEIFERMGADATGKVSIMGKKEGLRRMRIKLLEWCAGEKIVEAGHEIDQAQGANQENDLDDEEEEDSESGGSLDGHKTTASGGDKDSENAVKGESNKPMFYPEKRTTTKMNCVSVNKSKNADGRSSSLNRKSLLSPAKVLSAELSKKAKRRQREAEELDAALEEYGQENGDLPSSSPYAKIENKTLQIIEEQLKPYDDAPDYEPLIVLTQKQKNDARWFFTRGDKNSQAPATAEDSSNFLFLPDEGETTKPHSVKKKSSKDPNKSAKSKKQASKLKQQMQEDQDSSNPLHQLKKLMEEKRKEVEEQTRLKQQHAALQGENKNPLSHTHMKNEDAFSKTKMMVYYPLLLLDFDFWDSKVWEFKSTDEGQSLAKKSSRTREKETFRKDKLDFQTDPNADKSEFFFAKEKIGKLSLQKLKEDQELVEEENEKVLKDELTSHEEAVIEGHMQVQSGGLDTNYLLQLENQKRKSCREIVLDEVHKLADQLQNDDSATFKSNPFKTTTKERKQLAIKAVSDKVVQSLQSSVSELPVLAYTQNKTLLSPVMKAIQYRGEKLGLRVVSHAERDMSHMEELHEISLAAAKAEERRNARDSRISTRGSAPIGSSRPQTAATDHEVDESSVMKEEKQLLEMDESYHMRALHDSVRERFWDRSERQFVTEMLRGKVTWQELREWFGGSGKNYGSAMQSQQMLRNGLFLTDLIINYKLQNLDGSEARTNLEKDKQQRILLRTRLADQKDFGTKSFESAVRITEQAVEYFQRTLRKNKHLKNSAQREFSFLEHKKKLVNFAKKQLLQEWLTRFDRILLPRLEENALTSFETFHNMRMGVRTAAGGGVDAASSNGNQNIITDNRKIKAGNKQKQARDTSTQNAGASSSADPEALKEKGLIELKSHLKTSSNKTNIVKQPLHLEPIDPRWVGETAWVLKPKDLEDKGTSNQHKTDGTSLTGILSNARRSAKRSSLLAGEQMGGKSQDPMLQNISDGTARDTYLQHLDAVTDEEHYKSLKKIRLDQEQQHSAHMLVGVDLDRGLLNFDNSFAATSGTSPTGVVEEEEDGLEDGGNSDLDLFLEDPGMLHGVSYDHDGTAAASGGNLSRASTGGGLSNNYNRSSQLSSKGNKFTTGNTFNPRLLPTAGYQEIVSAKRVQLQPEDLFYTTGAADDRNHDTIADPAIFDSFATIAAESEDEEVQLDHASPNAPRSTTSAKSTLAAAHQPASTRTPASSSATPASKNHKQYWADPRELVHLLPNSRFPGAGTNILKKVDIKTLKISKSKQAASNFTNSASFFNRDKLLNAPKTDRMLIFESAAEHDRDVVLSYQEMLAEWILGPLLKPSRHIFKSQSEIKHREFLEKTPDVFSKRATEKMKTGLSQKVKQKHAVDTGLVQFLEHHELHDLRAILEAELLQDVSSNSLPENEQQVVEKANEVMNSAESSSSFTSAVTIQQMITNLSEQITPILDPRVAQSNTNQAQSNSSKSLNTEILPDVIEVYAHGAALILHKMEKRMNILKPVVLRLQTWWRQKQAAIKTAELRKRKLKLVKQKVLNYVKHTALPGKFLSEKLLSEERRKSMHNRRAGANATQEFHDSAVEGSVMLSNKSKPNSLGGKAVNKTAQETVEPEKGAAAAAAEGEQVKRIAPTEVAQGLDEDNLKNRVTEAAPEAQPRMTAIGGLAPTAQSLFEDLL